MQISQVTADQLVEMMAGGEVLATLETRPMVQVVRWTGVDVLVTVCPNTGDGVVISPCALDGDYGGSIHHHARQTFATA
ncbi:MAG: hypothetical protein A2Z90_15480 [Burkholderiales bacterium GWA2_64_37]|nr:MAG: hypothetical protein A2Z90_15480 [Burkholderiales bacterium GWA2_64_37]HCE92403.1 hypothetical protein [Acidovorax sp.]